MNDRQAMEYLESIAGRGIRPGLGSIEELCKRLGNPQGSLRFIHVAGTNGKGSTVAFLSGILACSGYRVGRFLSPAVREYREKIQVNGRMISRRALGEWMGRVREACDSMTQEGLPQPTPFEVETALAFCYFLEKKCDLVVLETGMGGLLDATNVVTGTLVEVIASIGMDHMQFLGNTLEEIAAQKAGIIKPGSVVVCMDQNPRVVSVIREKAAQEGAEFVLSDMGKIQKIRYGLAKQSFYDGEFGHLEIRLAGQHQIVNAALAVDACRALGRKGFPVTGEAVKEGLKQTLWPGRMTVLGKEPLFLIDGAHNEDAAEKLAKSIEYYFTNRRIIYIMGVLKDKEYDKVIALTHRYADQIITLTPPDNPRALSALELAQEVGKVHPRVTAAGSVEEAVEMARLLATPEDVILAFGSLSFLGRIMDLADKDKKAGSAKRG